MSDREVSRLRAALEEIRGHLGACIIQRIATDDRIIAEHIEDAYKIAKEADEACGPHVHRASNGTDACALCGHDLRHEIHAHH